MSEWLFVLVALLPAAAMLLAGFGGCNQIIGIEDPPTISYLEGILLEPRLVSYWRLEETTPTVANDTASSAPLGGVYSAAGVTLGQEGAIPPAESTSPADRCALFDGAAGFVQVAFAVALNPAPSFSVEAWANPVGAVTGAERVVLSSRDQVGGVRRGFELLINANGEWEARVGSGVDGEPFATATTAVQGSGTAEGWRHLVATYDGVAGALRLYVSSADGTHVETSGVVYAPNATRPLRIAAGRTEAAPQGFFAGRIDEVAVYDAALSADAVRTHFALAVTE